MSSEEEVLSIQDTQEELDYDWEPPQGGDNDHGLEEMLQELDDKAPETTNDLNRLDDVDEVVRDLIAKSSTQEFGNPLADGPAKYISNLLEKSYDTSRNKDHSQEAYSIMEKANKVTIPSNVKGLQPCKVNESIFKNLDRSTKGINMHAQMAETTVCKSIALQGQMMGDILALKDHIQPGGNDKLKSLIKAMAESIELCIFSRKQLNESRRLLCASKVNQNYKNITTKAQSADGLLFGNDLNDAMRDMDMANKLTSRLAKQPYRPFLGQRDRRNYPPRRASQPYQKRMPQEQTSRGRHPRHNHYSHR